MIRQTNTISKRDTKYQQNITCKSTKKQELLQKLLNPERTNEQKNIKLNNISGVGGRMRCVERFRKGITNYTYNYEYEVYISRANWGERKTGT